ncbi:chitin deacetylase [Nowakowskiella sp. JEL0407]|nr:chitin deacetylase [Nowakowskiella sp. JEL0407]
MSLDVTSLVGGECLSSPFLVSTFSSLPITKFAYGGNINVSKGDSWKYVNGQAVWTGTTDNSTWYATLFNETSTTAPKCGDISYLYTEDSTPYLALSLAKLSESTSVEIGLRIGCDERFESGRFKSIGVIKPTAQTLSKYAFVLDDLTVKEMRSVKAVVIKSGKGELGIANVQITCGPATMKTLKYFESIKPPQTMTKNAASCPVPAITVQTFDTSVVINILGGTSGTGGTGGYVIANGYSAWTPTISTTTSAFWFTQLHSSSVPAAYQCTNLYSFGSAVAVSIKLGKRNIGAANVTVGVDIGCETKVFKPIGVASFKGVETKTFVFDLLKGVTPTDLQRVKAIILFAASGSVPVGSSFTIDDIQIVCSSSTPYPLPSPVKTTTVPSPSPTIVPYCTGNGGHIYARIPGVRPVLASRCLKAGQFALTFDDGPQYYEQQLLNKINAHGIKVTFFFNSVNHANIEQEPYATWVRNVYKSGHQIASHTASHPDLTTQSYAQIISEMQRAETAIHNVIGRRPAMMRPPFGSYNANALKAIESLGYNSAVLWNLDTRDWDHNNAQMSMAAVKKALEFNCPVKGSSGVLELSHSTDSSCLTFIDLVVPYVRSRGYKFVTVSECLGLPAYK